MPDQMTISPDVRAVVSAYGVPVSEQQVRSITNDLYPVIMDRRSREYVGTAYAPEHAGLELPRHTPRLSTTTVMGDVRDAAGLAGRKNKVATVRLDAESMKRITDRVTPWTDPDDPAVITAFTNRVARTAERRVLNSARRTTLSIADMNNLRWYRKTTGMENCDLCRLLESRGAVYTRDTAFFETHDGCDCTAAVERI